MLYEMQGSVIVETHSEGVSLQSQGCRRRIERFAECQASCAALRYDRA
jgi:hypothetical protein